jgi:hypothetical protein
MAGKPLCKECPPGKKKPVAAKGVCWMHYMRQYRDTAEERDELFSGTLERVEVYLHADAMVRLEKEAAKTKTTRGRFIRRIVEAVMQGKVAIPVE